MSKSRHIAQIELYDEFGNLSMEALIAFAKGELNDAQKLEVQQAIDTDEMYADALEGILELEQPEDTRQAVYSINEKVRAQTGMQQSSSVSPQVWRVAAGLALFIGLSGSIVYVALNTNFIGNLATNNAQEKPLADNTAKNEKPEEIPVKEKELILLSDSSAETGEMMEMIDEEIPPAEMEAPTLIMDVDEGSDQTVLESNQIGIGATNQTPKSSNIMDTRNGTITATGGTSAPIEKESLNSISLDGYLSQSEKQKNATSSNSNTEVSNLKAPQKPTADKKDVADRNKNLEKETDKLEEKAEVELARKAEESRMVAEQLAKRKSESERKAKENAARQKTQQAEAEPAFAYDMAEDDASPADIGTEETYYQKDASFPGGQKAMKEYFAKKLKLEPETKGGTVLISFTIDEKGKVTNAKVKRGIAKDVDNEALRVVKSMPKWIPAEENGRKVSSKVIVPVEIKPQW